MLCIVKVPRSQLKSSVLFTGCDKTKMRGHKCSYRVKLTMRLGYVNHWFVEVLGSHDQFAVTNYSLNQRIINSPLSKSNSSPLSSSSPSPNQRTPPGGRKSESPCHSPKMNLSPNMNLPNNETLNNGASNIMPIGLPTQNLPNSLAPLVNNLPNSILSSHALGLPLAFPHVLGSQSAIFSSQNNHGTMFSSAPSQYFPIMQNTDQSCPQDMPLPLVKVKKEPMDTDYQDKHVTMATNIALNTNGHQISSVPQERAKVRKRFTPVQRESRGSSANMSEAELNGPRIDIDSHVRKELRDLVNRREHERGVLGSEDYPVNYCMNGIKSSDDPYTYVWDGETRTVEMEVNDRQNQPKVDLLFYNCTAWCQKRIFFLHCTAWYQKQVPFIVYIVQNSAKN